MFLTKGGNSSRLLFGGVFMVGTLKSVYFFIEKNIFNSLSRKLAGNVMFFIFFQMLFILIFMNYLDLINHVLTEARINRTITDTINGITNRTLYEFVGVYALSIVAGVLIVLFLRYLIVRPIKEITTVLTDIGKGEGDISKSLPVTTYDDIRNLSESYNLFLGKLREIIGMVRKMGICIAIDSAGLGRAIRNSYADTKKQGELADVVFNSSNEANRAIQEVAKNAQYISGSTSSNMETARMS